MVVKGLLKRGSNVYGTGVKGAHKLVSAAVKTPLKMAMVLTNGTILSRGFKTANKKVGATLNTGFGIVGMPKRPKKRSSPKRKSPMRKSKRK